MERLTPMTYKQQYKIFAVLFILALASSCSENYTQNRAYVISQTQVETEDKAASIPAE